MSNTGGGEGRWPFERVGEGASPGPTPQGPSQSFTPHASSTPQGPGGGWGPAASATPPQTPSPAAPSSGFGVHAGSARPAAETDPAATPPGSRRDGKETRPGRRRPPLWLLILIGVVVIGAVVAAVLLLTQQDEPEVPPAETITLPVPTPTIDAIAREPGTPFFEALPSEVLQFALTEVGQSDDLLVGGALEGYRLLYSDGGAATVTVLAGQWRDATGPQARLDAVLAQVVAEVGEVPEASSLPEPEPSAPADEAGEDGEDTEDAGDDASAPATQEPLPSAEQGPVEVDGQAVGRYVFLPREDGTGTLWWTNATVFVQLDGPWAELQDVFTAYPL